MVYDSYRLTVKDREVMAAFDKVARHVAAHVAQSNESNLQFTCNSFVLCMYIPKFAIKQAEIALKRRIP